MNARIKLPRHAPLVVATRGDAVESVHYGSFAAVSASGERLCAVGDVDFPMFTRSTLKPFQALPFVADGGAAHFGFSAAQVALMCGSHSGEARHVDAVADMLMRGGCTVGELQCGCHVPLFYSATGAAVPPDLALTPLQHNCSGKHAGFLAACRLHGAPTAAYLEPTHPVQAAVRAHLAQIAGCGENDLVMGVDGCSAPNYALPLSALALMYAQLACPAAESPHAAALTSIFDAMSAHPEMVSGEGRVDLALARAVPGDWVAKGGAEGMQALAVRSRGLGIALKIADGSRKVLYVALAALVERLGLLPAGDAALARWREDEIVNYAGRRTGRLLPVFADTL